jgi:hypothetical protein
VLAAVDDPAPGGRRTTTGQLLRKYLVNAALNV